MKVTQIKTKTITGANAAALDAAIVAWTALQTEAEFMEIQYIVDGGVFSVLILYTT